MREPASREVPLMASVGLLLDQAVLAVGAILRSEALSQRRRQSLEELLGIAEGVAALESAPLGIFQASAVQSSADFERLEAFEDTKPPAGAVAWATVRDQLEAILNEQLPEVEVRTLRASLVELAEASLTRTSELVEWRPNAGDPWDSLDLNSSLTQ